jgi:RNA polymerase sigma-70 factor (ECF subfamily)
VVAIEVVCELAQVLQSTAPMDEQGRSSLLREARAGSGQALDDLFREVGPPLLALIRFRLGPLLRRRIDSQDVLQATLLKAFARLDQFEGSGTNTLMGWLAVIARNEIRDQAAYHRRERRDVAAEVPIDNQIERLEANIRTLVRKLELDEQQARLERALDVLKPEHREVILLRKYEDLSFEEIGNRLGKTPDAARMLLARAMQALTRAME